MDAKEPSIISERIKVINKTRVAHILAIAASDDMTEYELGFIISRARNIGMSEDDIQEVLNRPDKYTGDIAHSNEEKLQLLFDIFAIIMVDGKISSGEIKQVIEIMSKLDIDISKIINAVDAFSLLLTPYSASDDIVLKRNDWKNIHKLSQKLKKEYQK